jgi:hypothetical protein
MNLAEEIHNKLSNDPKIHSFIKEIRGGKILARHLSSSCGCEEKCRILPVYDGTKWMLDFTHGHHCREAIAQFSLSMPLVDTFLQRYMLVQRIKRTDSFDTCPMCYKQTGRTFLMERTCRRCILGLMCETKEMIEKQAIIGEIIGRDCVGVIMRYLLNFLRG